MHEMGINVVRLFFNNDKLCYYDSLDNKIIMLLTCLMQLGNNCEYGYSFGIFINRY